MTDRVGDPRRGRRVAIALLAFAVVLPATAKPPVWEYENGPSRFRLLGSIHYLREDDYPLPENVRRAYVESESLVVEYDTRSEGQAVRAMVLTRRVPRAGRVDPAGELRRALTTSEFTDLRRLARNRGYDVNRLDDFRPWFAGMFVLDRELGKAGFQSEFGLDNKLLERAYEDGKPVISLDTERDQRHLFREIPMDDQVEFLTEALKDAPRIAPAMRRLVETWRQGDLDGLDRQLLENLRRRPDEYRRFSVERNKRWANRLEALPADGTDYLVVVGMVHLLGDSSLIAMLRERGYAVRRFVGPAEEGQATSATVHQGR